jgi:predicted RecA/RadA family phage recombinase
MRNFVQYGDILTLTAPYAVSSGGGVLVGTNIFGIATNDIANAASGEVKTRGVFDITALGTDTGSAGTIWYWDNTNKRVTTTSAGNTKIGVGTGTKANGETTARVRLNGVFG